jgi:hypothetical protein
VGHHPQHLQAAEVTHAVILHGDVQKGELDINVRVAKAVLVDFINGRSTCTGPAAAGSITGVTALNTCPDCSCPGDQQLLSRHRTADGLLTYTRCRCGALHVWLWPHDPAAARHLARGRPDLPG